MIATADESRLLKSLYTRAVIGHYVQSVFNHIDAVNLRE